MKTKVFVSSTCFDLAVVRENMNTLLVDLGHQPLLSEFSSFPVDPDTNTIENCTKNIQTQTDLFILIIGGKRGSMDPDSSKSITNVEYDAACRKGIPIFTFVKQDVLNLMPIWEANSLSDFHPVVDNPDVFRFIKHIQKASRWVFTFNKFQDIKDTLVNQFSYLLQSLLEEKRRGNLSPADLFANESLRAREIVRKKPKFWEHLLTVELLKAKFQILDEQFGDLDKGLVFGKARFIRPRELLDILTSKAEDLISLANMSERLFKELRESWGPDGTPGNERLILAATEKFQKFCRDLYEWEVDLLTLNPTAELKPLRETMKGWGKDVYSKIRSLPEELALLFANGAPAPGEHNILIKLDPPKNERFLAELNRLRRDHLNLFVPT